MIAVFPVRSRAELEAAYAIRQAVFVAEQGVPESEEIDAFDETARHVLARDAEGAPLGTARAIPYDAPEAPGPTWKIGRVAVLAPGRGRGVGAALMRALEQQAAEAAIRSLVLDAQTQALGFYERLGYVPTGPIFDDCGIPHRRMTKRLA